jgi:Holliday junction resolvase RusA-like endonuclease
MSWGITMPDRRTRDLDNCLKAIGDALKDAQVYPDDSQVMALYITKDYQPGVAEVRLAVHVQEGEDTGKGL